jgi:hypothetical protein
MVGALGENDDDGYDRIEVGDRDDGEGDGYIVGSTLENADELLKADRVSVMPSVEGGSNSITTKPF